MWSSRQTVFRLVSLVGFELLLSIVPCQIPAKANPLLLTSIRYCGRGHGYICMHTEFYNKGIMLSWNIIDVGACETLITFFLSCNRSKNTKFFCDCFATILRNVTCLFHLYNQTRHSGTEKPKQKISGAWKWMRIELLTNIICILKVNFP